MKRTHTIIEHDSTREEWLELRNRLEVLNESQIRQLAAKIGISFSGSDKASKDEYVDILDEAYWDELTEAYKHIVGKDLA